MNTDNPLTAEGTAPTETPVDHTAPPAEPAPADPQRRTRQRAFLLQQLAGADSQRLTRGEANKKAGKTAIQELGLDRDTAHRLREEMAGEQLLTITKKGSSVVYQLTPQGREHLQTIAPSPPPPEVPENLLPYMKAFVLLDLFLQPNQTANKGDLDRRLPRPGKREGARQPKKDPLKELGLTAGPVADHVRQLLAEKGYIRVTRSLRTTSYSLTPDGVEYLTTLPQYPDLGYHLSGTQIDQLVKAIREASFREPAAQPRPAETPTAADEHALL